MSEIYFTITGTNHWQGKEFIEPGVGQIGYVANSPYTVIGESWSAGRIYDRIGEKASGEVLFILPGGVLCKLEMN